MARVLLGVRGMDTQGAAEVVKRALLEVEGVSKVDTAPDAQAAVEYDPGSATVMDMIRALRKQGFLAGME